MAPKVGLVTNAEAWGKEADLERDIKKVGWTQTPFLSTISSAAPASRSGLAAQGHRWYYDVQPDGDTNNAHVEGSAPAPAKYYVGGELSNHYQIVKHTYGLSGSEKESSLVNGKTVLADQFEKTTMDHKKSIEKILLSSQAAVQRVNTTGAEVPGKCGGLKSFATANNTINATGATLTLQFIRDLMKIGFLNGLNYSKMQLGDIQMDVIDDIMNSKIAVNAWGMETIADGVTRIKTKYGKCDLILNPYLADDEIIPYDPSMIYKVNWRAMGTHEIARTKDAIEKEIISEFTLRVCHEYAFAYGKGLATS